jgi:hypothetical protein
MIDSFNDNFTGWARFSDEKLTEPRMRFRLARACSIRAAGYIALQRLTLKWPGALDLIRVVFVMLNPSTADAFKPDPTVTECIKFARRWYPELDIVEVVNLFAFRTPYPAVLKRSMERGDDTGNYEQIMEACTGASMVITAWGVGGALDNRDIDVNHMLAKAGIARYHLGRTAAGHPKHPLARGKHRIPADQQPIPCV